MIHVQVYCELSTVIMCLLTYTMYTEVYNVLQSLANTKHLYNIYTMLDQRRRRWADVVYMLYKCFLLDERQAAVTHKQEYLRSIFFSSWRC